MCTILYGGVNKEANSEDIKMATTGNYTFLPTTKGTIRKSVGDNWKYRITSGHCDCGTTIGENKADAIEVVELAACIDDLRNVRDIQCICLLKHSEGSQLKRSECIHIDDIDISQFLADLMKNRLYEIQLFYKTN